MELLLRRSQTGPLRHVKFMLWAKTELDETEQKIMYRYRIDEAIVLRADQPNLKRNSIVIGVLAGLAFGWLFATATHGSIFTLLGVPLGAAAGYFYFDNKREYLLMRDLLHGRYFTCRSIVELVRKEHWVEDAVAVLRQVMETAKHWDGTEVIPVEVLTKEAAKFVTRRSFL